MNPPEDMGIISDDSAAPDIRSSEELLEGFERGDSKVLREMWSILQKRPSLRGPVLEILLRHLAPPALSSSSADPDPVALLERGYWLTDISYLASSATEEESRKIVAALPCIFEWCIYFLHVATDPESDADTIQQSTSVTKEIPLIIWRFTLIPGLSHKLSSIPGSAEHAAHL
ncbi:hypothetical protein M422DRAFT_245659 [Sphaerobolus stellatus SS14]|nr:hypothetical protein M422DRAFT_245659 [Sphaerobolus stellatus SS14]